MSTAFISIIIPVFNAEPTLLRAIESVISQTYTNRELIIIDGGSTDGSAELVQSFGSQLAYFISEKDRGVYDAINKGIEVAKGNWIYVLGADDHLNDERVLEKIFSNDTGADQLIFGNVINDEAGNKLVPAIHRSEFGTGLRWRNTLHQQSVFYHSSLFSAFRFEESMKVLADYDFHLLLLTISPAYKKTDLTIAHCSAQGLSKNFGWALYREELRMKYKRLNIVLWLLNVPWVIGKFMVKKLG